MRKIFASLRIFVSGAWLAYIALFTWTQPTSYLASKIIAPLTYILFFTFLGMSATGRDTAEFYIVGNAMQVAANNGIYGVTMTVGRERNEGTLIYLIGSPANRLVTFFGTGPFQYSGWYAHRGVGLYLGRFAAGAGFVHRQPAPPGTDHLDHHSQHLRPGTVDGQRQPGRVK